MKEIRITVSTHTVQQVAGLHIQLLLAHLSVAFQAALQFDSTEWKKEANCYVGAVLQTAT